MGGDCKSAVLKAHAASILSTVSGKPDIYLQLLKPCLLRAFALLFWTEPSLKSRKETPTEIVALTENLPGKFPLWDPEYLNCWSFS